MASRTKKTIRRLLHRVRGWERRMGLRPEFELKTVLPRAEFERELARQGSFADRAGTRCFLLRFALSPSFRGEREEAMECLAASVCARVRLSDIAGHWADPEECIAILLRGARPEGAVCVTRAVIDDFERRMRKACPAIETASFLCAEARSFPEGAGEPGPGREDGTVEMPAPRPS